MVLPEHLEEFFEVGDVGVVVDADGLGVVAQVVVGGLVLGAARVADAGAHDAPGAAELRLGEPESAHAERGRPQGRLLHRRLRRRHRGGLGRHLAAGRLNEIVSLCSTGICNVVFLVGNGSN